MAGATVLPWVVMREGHKGSSCADVGSPNSYVVVTRHAVVTFCAITQKVHSARWRFASSRDGSRHQTPSVGEERKPRHAGAAKIMRDDVYGRRATIPRLHVETHARRVARQRDAEVRVESCHTKMHERTIVTVAPVTRPLTCVCTLICWLSPKTKTFPWRKQSTVENDLCLYGGRKIQTPNLFRYVLWFQPADFHWITFFVLFPLCCCASQK